MSKDLIIIPTYNELENVDPLFTQIFEVYPEVAILVVDDASGDGTAHRVREWMEKRKDQVHLLEREGKLGLGTAYVAGFKWGLAKGFENIVEMDADFSHNPTYLPTMFQNLKEYEFAIGSRNIPEGGVRNWSLLRKFISRFGSLYARLILGTPIFDLTGGFNGWRSEVLRKMNPDSIKSDGYAFQIELKHRAYKLGFSYREFPIIFEDRRVGQSKMSTMIVLEALIRVWQIRFIV